MIEKEIKRDTEILRECVCVCVGQTDSSVSETE